MLMRNTHLVRRWVVEVAMCLIFVVDWRGREDSFLTSSFFRRGVSLDVVGRRRGLIGMVCHRRVERSGEFFLDIVTFRSWCVLSYQRRWTLALRDILMASTNFFLTRTSHDNHSLIPPSQILPTSKIITHLFSPWQKIGRKRPRQ